MNIEITHLTHGNTGNSNNFNTASITPPSNQLIIVTVAEHVTSDQSPSAPEPIITGCNLTWEKIATIQNPNDNKQRISMFRGMGANPTTGVLNINGVFTIRSIFWSVDAFKPVAKNGSNGSGAVVQSATVSHGTSDPMNMTLNFSAFGNTKNATFVAFISPDMPTVPTGFTSVVALSQDLGPDNNFRVAFKNSPATSVNTTSTGSGAEVACGVGCEIKFKKPGGFIAHL